MKNLTYTALMDGNQCNKSTKQLLNSSYQAAAGCRKYALFEKNEQLSRRESLALNWEFLLDFSKTHWKGIFFKEHMFFIMWFDVILCSTCITPEINTSINQNHFL